MRRLTREELYALVWASPMTKVAKQFGLSDVALHKICRKHNVPTPPQGYTYGSVGDLLDTYVRLKNAGIESYWPVHHGTTMSLYYIDPDGNRMEFQVDVGTVEEATALMRAPAYAEIQLAYCMIQTLCSLALRLGRLNKPCSSNRWDHLRQSPPHMG